MRDEAISADHLRTIFSIREDVRLSALREIKRHVQIHWQGENDAEVSGRHLAAAEIACDVGDRLGREIEELRGIVGWCVRRLEPSLQPYVETMLARLSDSGSDPKGENAQAVECEASQSGAESASPDLGSKAGALVGKLA